ncbi:MAG: DUF4864 domain-containing protein [Cohaesibacter sp.]|jgi:hypothetical protein|nr:DUF4864 domain-containing protein [Cohaesibacter sp.]
MMKRYFVSGALALAVLSAGVANADQSIIKPPAQNIAIDKTLPAPAMKPLKISVIDKAIIAFVVRMHVGSLSQQKPDQFSKTFTQKTQDHFKSADQMLAFFSRRYFPVRHGKSFQLDTLSLSGDVPVQHGYLIDTKGLRWRVSYGLKDMGNKKWRIVSTVITLAPGTPT